MTGAQAKGRKKMGMICGYQFEVSTEPDSHQYFVNLVWDGLRKLEHLIGAEVVKLWADAELTDNVRDNHQIIQAKIKQIQNCEHEFISITVGGIAFIGGEVFDDVEEIEYCPMCGCLKSSVAQG